MYTTYQLRPVKKQRSGGHGLSRYVHSSTVWVALASLLVCLLIGWVAVQICSHTGVASSSSSPDLPRNQVNMHSVYGAQTALNHTHG